MPRTEYSLLCDDATCTRQHGASANDEESARLLLLEEARLAGWVIDERGHWCPEHSEGRVDQAALGLSVPSPSC